MLPNLTTSTARFHRAMRRSTFWQSRRLPTGPGLQRLAIQPTPGSLAGLLCKMQQMSRYCYWTLRQTSMAALFGQPPRCVVKRATSGSGSFRATIRPHRSQPWLHPPRHSTDGLPASPCRTATRRTVWLLSSLDSNPLDANTPADPGRLAPVQRVLSDLVALPPASVAVFIIQQA